MPKYVVSVSFQGRHFTRIQEALYGAAAQQKVLRDLGLLVSTQKIPEALYEEGDSVWPLRSTQ